MRPIAIQFGGTRRRGLGWFATGLVALTAVCVIQVAMLQRNHRLASQIREARRAVDVERGRLEQIDPLVMRRSNAATIELHRPWEELFSAIEEARSDQISLLSIEPDVNSGRVRIDAQATDFREALGFVERLSRRPPLHDVALTGRNVDRVQPIGQVRFVVEAQWLR